MVLLSGFGQRQPIRIRILPKQEEISVRFLSGVSRIHVKLAEKSVCLRGIAQRLLVFRYQTQRGRSENTAGALQILPLQELFGIFFADWHQFKLSCFAHLVPRQINHSGGH